MHIKPEPVACRPMANSSSCKSLRATIRSMAATGPAGRLRVIDISRCGRRTLRLDAVADLGAEVSGGNDRTASACGARPHKDGVSLWWKVTNANRRASRSTCGKKRAELLGPPGRGHDVCREFRTGTLDGMGHYEGWLQRSKPAADHPARHASARPAPYRNTPGFARVFER